MKRLRRLIFIFTCFHFQSAHAQVFRGPISGSMAGTGVAGINATESALLNPALVPIWRESGLDAYYQDGQTDAARHSTAFGLGAVDNEADVWFPGALHYIRTRLNGVAAQPVNGELWHAAIAQRYDRLAIGMAVYRLQYETQGSPRLTQWNGSVGGVFMFTPNIGVGYVIRNPVNPGSNVPLALRQDLEQALGLLYGVGEHARLRFDIQREEHFNPDHKMAYALGLESKTNDFVAFRLGYKYDDLADRRLICAGFGFEGPRLRLEYAFEKTQEHTSGALHSVDLRLAF